MAYTLQQLRDLRKKTMDDYTATMRKIDELIRLKISEPDISKIPTKETELENALKPAVAEVVE